MSLTLACLHLLKKSRFDQTNTICSLLFHVNMLSGESYNHIISDLYNESIFHYRVRFVTFSEERILQRRD